MNRSEWVPTNANMCVDRVSLRGGRSGTRLNIGRPQVRWGKGVENARHVVCVLREAGRTNKPVSFATIFNEVMTQARTVAEQFGLPIIPTKAALVPFTLHEHDKAVIGELSGISVDASASCNNTSFNESILFTHRGLSGPAVLQVSSFWDPGQEVEFDLFPNGDLVQDLVEQQQSNPEIQLSTALGKHYSKRFVQAAIPYFELANKPLKQYTAKQLQTAAEAFTQWQIKPNGTEGYRTAEVTLGGVDTDYVSSKNMQVKGQEGLFFIGEVLDVTGWLGGYNFQWAWSSGWVAGQVA